MQSSENSSDLDRDSDKINTVKHRRTFKGLRGPACNRIDLSGQVFSGLTVLEYHGTSRHNQSLWKCRCECGNDAIVAGIYLRSRTTRSCGCLRKYVVSQQERGTKYDLTGQTFGRLTVVCKTARPQGRKVGHFWTCQCSCGTVGSFETQQLVKRSSTSCGCLRRELLNKHGRGIAAENAVIKTYKKAAANRHLPFLLTDDECRKLLSSRCHYCGCSPKNVMTSKSFNGSFTYNGIDRLENSKGYETTNVAPACYDCNRSKCTMGYQQFLDWVARVYRHAVAPSKGKHDTVPPLALF